MASVAWSWSCCISYFEIMFQYMFKVYASGFIKVLLFTRQEYRGTATKEGVRLGGLLLLVVD